jgi:hypothetical protein
LVLSMMPAQCWFDFVVHDRGGIQHAKAGVSAWITVASFVRLVGTSGGTRGHRRPGEGAVGKPDIYLNRRPSARVKDLTAPQSRDECHSWPPCCSTGLPLG